jgi:sugar (pentulose or hexulose) kinase
MMWGFTLRHTPAHVARAIMEGVAYGTEHILQVFRQNGYVVQEVVACGGAVNSPLWLQIHSDISNVPITFTKVGEAATLGSAILGAVAGGLHDSVQEAAAAMVHAAERITPNREAHEMYKYYYESYVKTYPAMKDLLHGMARHVAAHGAATEIRRAADTPL